MFVHLIPFAAASGITKGFGIAVGGGLGAVGAGVGIGIIFGKVIEGVVRQPEMRDEITSIQWLGFALTEAVFFYGLLRACSRTCSRDRGRLAYAHRLERLVPDHTQRRADDLDAPPVRHLDVDPVEARLPADLRGA